MPSVQYDNSPVITKPKLNLKKFTSPLFIVIITLLTYYLSAILTGIISAISTNISVTSLNIIFDPQITIAYILVYYAISQFYKFSNKQAYLYFLFSLLLSFTTNFIQGSLVILILPPLLTKLKLTIPQE